MADIPGIIEGASEGKGLGLRFLRHIERNAVLLFMVPSTSEDVKAEYNILLNELEQYNPELLTKARILAISKCDAITAEDLKKLKLDRLASKLNIPVLPISSVAGTGLDELKDALWVELNKEQNQVIEISHAPIDVTFIEKEEADSDDLTEEEQKVVSLLQDTNDLQLNVISVKTDIPIGQLTALLFSLEMKGVIKPLAGGMYHIMT
jgi:GTP-binding protein